MEIEMKYIYEIFKQRSFSKAAEILYVTQPTLSLAVKRVESELGMPIFERKKNPITLTPAGEIYINKIKLIKRIEQDLEDEINDLKRSESETQEVSHETQEAPVKYANEIIRVKQVVSESTLPITKINSSCQVVEWLQQEYSDESQEVLILICLNTKNVITDFSVVTRGTLNQSIAHPRDIFQRALLSNARSIILAHNHPSGDVTPSRNDNETTNRIKKCGDLMGIALLDHIIIGDNNYYSYAEQVKL